MNAGTVPDFLESVIVDRINVGVFVVDRDRRIALWNRFMATHSGMAPQQVLGRRLFDVFPELDERWLTKKIDAVFLLGNYAFTSCEQRAYLFRFTHNRPVTGTVDHMQQDCTFLPVKDEDGRVRHVCVTVFDATDAAIYRTMMKSALLAKEEMSVRDGLTGLYNRRHLETTLEAEFKRARRHGQELSVVMVDVDHFKRINDTYGHRSGDVLLKAVAANVRSLLRSSDTAGRYGGEEFTLILPETGLGGAMEVGERVRKLIAGTHVAHRDVSLSVTVSVGVSSLRDATPDHERLLDEADKALYEAKASGRDRVTAFRPADG